MMTVADACAALVGEFKEGGIALPSGQRRTVAATLAGLCQIAGEEVPAAVLAALDFPTGLPPVAVLPGPLASAADLTITDILRRCAHPAT